MNLLKLSGVIKKAVIAALPNTVIVLIQHFDGDWDGDEAARVIDVFASREDAILHATGVLASYTHPIKQILTKSVEFPIQGVMVCTEDNNHSRFIVSEWSKEKFAEILTINSDCSVLIHHPNYSEQPENSPHDTSVA